MGCVCRCLPEISWADHTWRMRLPRRLCGLERRERAASDGSLPFPPTHLYHPGKHLGNSGLMHVCGKPLRDLDTHVPPSPRGQPSNWASSPLILNNVGDGLSHLISWGATALGWRGEIALCRNEKSQSLPRPLPHREELLEQKSCDLEPNYRGSTRKEGRREVD